MPFTLAHPAAVLPLARGPLVPAALVAGSLSPDVPYFVPVPRSAGSWYEPFVNATTTHAWPGALSVAVPTAVVLLGLWWAVRAPLRVLVDAGGPAQRPAVPVHGSGAQAGGPVVPVHVPAARVAGSAARSLAATVWVLVSVALGVLTHVAWDAVTHGDGVVVQHIAWLREPLVGDVPAARVLQHASTAVGLLVLAVWAVRSAVAWRARGGRLVLGRWRTAVLALLGVAGIAGAVVGLVGAAGSGAEGTLSAVAKTGGTAFAAAGLAAAALWWLGRLTGRPTPQP
ncbi:DUF4184 family protein [Cellulomonas sp. NPDC055163]